MGWQRPGWRHWLMAGLTVLLLVMPLAALENAPNHQGLLESPTTGNFYFLDQVLPELRQAGVIYLGETHDRAADHQAQLALIQALYAQHGDLAIGLEMFSTALSASAGSIYCRCVIGSRVAIAKSVR
jgi:uncharacterized iron-regulated protein